MDFFQLIKLIRDKRWKEAGRLAVAILGAFVELMPDDGLALESPRAATAVDYDAMSVDELCNTMEAEMHGHSEGLSAAPPTGPVLDILRPILAALIKKLLGL